MRTDGTLHGGFFDGGGAGIAEAEEDFLSAPGFIQRKKLDGVFQRLHTKIRLLTSTLNAIKKGRKVDELAAGIHEPEVHEIDVLRRCPVGHKNGD